MGAMTDEEIGRALEGLPGWNRTPEGLRKSFRRKDFLDALALVNTVAQAAEAADHHPDILVHGYRNVSFTLMTHSAGGITERDVALARVIEGLAGTA